MSGYTLREAESGDASAIFDLHRAAFETEAEASLVRSLSEDGDIVLSLVAESGGAIIGSAIYSRLLMDGEDRGVSALAPLGVLPDWQARGVGSALIVEAHARLMKSGENLVIVLGDPAYYKRFGFSVEAARNFSTPYDGPYLMALDLSKNAPKSGAATYANAFADLA